MNTMQNDELETVRNTVDEDGFDYAFLHYSNFEYVTDQKFHQLRQAYIEAHRALAKYIGADIE